MALALLALVGLGVYDLGLRMDEQITGMTECFTQEEWCRGRELTLSYLPVVDRSEVGFTLAGPGFEMRIVNWQGPPLPDSLVMTAVSVQGTYLGDQRMSGSTGMVHGFRKVKRWVGLLVLVLWIGFTMRWCLERYRG